MDLVGDLAFLFDEFAEQVVVGTSAIRAIFDNGSADALDIAGTLPKLTCRTSDVDSAGVSTFATVRGQSYRVVSNDPDGTGVTVLKLEKQ